MAIGRSSIPQQITKVPSKKEKLNVRLRGELKMAVKEYTYNWIKNPRTQEDVLKMTGKPTGQGFGAARKGPQVKGAEQDVVVDYEPGKIVEYND